MNKKLRYVDALVEEMEWHVPNYDEMFPDEFFYALTHRDQGGESNE